MVKKPLPLSLHLRVLTREKAMLAFLISLIYGESIKPW
jgi:hypothetical protein